MISADLREEEIALFASDLENTGRFERDAGKIYFRLRVGGSRYETAKPLLGVREMKRFRERLANQCEDNPVIVKMRRM